MKGRLCFVVSREPQRRCSPLIAHAHAGGSLQLRNRRSSVLGKPERRNCCLAAGVCSVLLASFWQISLSHDNLMPLASSAEEAASRCKTASPCNDNDVFCMSAVLRLILLMSSVVSCTLADNKLEFAVVDSYFRRLRLFFSGRKSNCDLTAKTQSLFLSSSCQLRTTQVRMQSRLFLFLLSRKS